MARNAQAGFHQFKLHPKGLDGPAATVLAERVVLRIDFVSVHLHHTCDMARHPLFWEQLESPR